MAQGFVFSAAVLWALSGLVVKVLLGSGLGALEIAFWRALLGGSVFVVHGALNRKLRLETPTDLGVLTGLAFFGVALHFISFNFAVQYGGVSLAVLCVAFGPALVALGAGLFLGEPVGRSKVGFVGMGVVGLAVVALAGGAETTVSVPALLWGGVAALSVASYDLIGKWLLRRYSPVAMSAVLMPLAALGLLPFVSFTVKTPQHWVLLALLAGLSTYLGHLLYQTGLQRLEASRASLLVSVEPVVAMSLAVLLFGERLAPAGLVGSGLILMASVGGAFSLKRQPTARNAPQTPEVHPLITRKRD